MNEFLIIKASWPEHSKVLKSIRKSVFVIEQGVAPKIEWDGRDHLCQHVIAYTNDQQPIGTGRILPSGHIGRIAVKAAWRKQGIGGKILEQLVLIAQENNLPRVYLNSQCHATGFYKSYGFIADGTVFMEAGIPHQRMNLEFN